MSPSALTPPPTTEQVSEALARVNDPEIRRPITELGMVKNVAIAPDGRVRVEVYLTVARCPGPEGRRARRRHLRALGAADAGRDRAAHPGREDDHAARRP